MIAADDPRHGRRAGYIAGCHDECCRPHHLRYQKFSTLRRHREGSQFVDSTRTRIRLGEWARYGVTPHAIGDAANIGDGTVCPIVAHQLDRVRRNTERAILAVTWDDLPDTALVNAGLTRLRIYSAMASGHPLTWITDHVDGISLGGKWRRQDRVSLGVARAVMELCDRAPAFGPSKHTAAKARNRGYLPLAAWDDPGTPAMPADWLPTTDLREVRNDRTDVDPVVVDRLLDGDPIPHTIAERRAAVARLWALGLGPVGIAKRCGLDPEIVAKDIERCGLRRAS